MLINNCCLKALPQLPASSVNMVLADPPYGTTRCKWDSTIPLQPLWKELFRVCVPEAAVVMTATQPFTTELIASHMHAFKYCLVWDKIRPVGHLRCQYRPMAQHEDICVFYWHKPTYNPQMVKRDKAIEFKEYKRTEIIGGKKNMDYVGISTHKHPTTIIRMKGVSTKTGRYHPTQKPVELMEYLIKTYTNEGDTVLDFAMGSGSTGVACSNLGRKFVGIEKDKEYCRIAAARIAAGRE